MTAPQSLVQHEPQTANLDDNFCSKLASRWQALRHRNGVPTRVFAPIPQTSQERLDASANDAPLDTENLAWLSTRVQEKQKTVLYLAYGSNLCNETFLGKRGIQPLSQINVLVPSLRLTFDLPGIPYAEPCFGNTALRTPDALHNEKEDYHKDRWHKGLIGVVYEVTLSDYAHIIATEGGGSSYKDILVDCHVLPDEDIVPSEPSAFPFKAHTLFAPLRARPDPSYAQASGRYLKLITDGAAERRLPAEYREYLANIRPYTITSKKQAVGKAIFLGFWMPLVLLLFGISRLLQDKDGRTPKWFGRISTLFFTSMWKTYDHVFLRAFGDGERTVGQSLSSTRDFQGSGTINNEEKQGLLEDASGYLHGKIRGETASSGKWHSMV